VAPTPRGVASARDDAHERVPSSPPNRRRSTRATRDDILNFATFKARFK
jgi:hypothetical protein